jgi:hypothetical protein
MRNAQGLQAAGKSRHFNDPSDEIPVDESQGAMNVVCEQTGIRKKCSMLHRVRRPCQDDNHVVPIEWNREAAFAHQRLSAERQQGRKYAPLLMRQSETI